VKNHSTEKQKKKSFHLLPGLGLTEPL